MKLYTQPTCGPCQMVKQMIEAEGLDVEIIDDLDAFPPGVRSVPTLATEDGSLKVGAPQIMGYLSELSP